VVVVTGSGHVSLLLLCRVLSVTVVHRASCVSMPSSTLMLCRSLCHVTRRHCVVHHHCCRHRRVVHRTSPVAVVIVVVVMPWLWPSASQRHCCRAWMCCRCCRVVRRTSSCYVAHCRHHRHFHDAMALAICIMASSLSCMDMSCIVRCPVTIVCCRQVVCHASCIVVSPSCVTIVVVTPWQSSSSLVVGASTTQVVGSSCWG